MKYTDAYIFDIVEINNSAFFFAMHYLGTNSTSDSFMNQTKEVIDSFFMIFTK